MKPLTKKVALWYSLWVILWLGITYFGNGELGISSFFYLTITGLPFSLLGWNLTPHGGLLNVSIIGAIGLIQWCLFVEANALITTWWKSRNTHEKNT